MRRLFVVAISVALAADRAAGACGTDPAPDAPAENREAGRPPAGFGDEPADEEPGPVCTCDAGTLMLTVGDAAPLMLRHESLSARCGARVPAVSAQCGTRTNSVEGCYGGDGGLPCVAFRATGSAVYGSLDLDGSPVELWDGSFASSRSGPTYRGRFTACAVARGVSSPECPLPVEGTFETCAFFQGPLTCR